MKRITEELKFAYQWRAGSMPPPHHYTYSIGGSSAGRGRIVFVPGYAFENPPTWTEEFDIDAAALAHLEQALADTNAWQRPWQAVESHAVGGSLRSFSFEQGEHKIDIPAELSAEDRAAIAAIEDAVKALVPEPLWQALRDRHQEYKKNLGED